MLLGRVIGNVISTRKDEKLVGYKLLIVQQIDFKCNPIRYPMVAVDTVGAGVGEYILLSTGSSARYSSGEKKESPIDLSIVGIIDNIEYDRNLDKEMSDSNENLYKDRG
ncbi:ethanolamine utilization protein [Thermoanaerobacterium thermosaccharolyticum]|uniref:Ethanolamine utilization protein n=1 Tax=Thermoanaerobacterium thermosaccharolyticum TaxID=1517 RepID=A0A223HZR7_THETR|nr:EutN/CcmL family microcompartment protein [Thermoanaerobacterium thermosaccharolyticum]AST57941.1 ethanolamine utilization protein [Thermoanaerobacterium thermosaccharolyticum]